jgi:hypothetical protein
MEHSREPLELLLKFKRRAGILGTRSRARRKRQFMEPAVLGANAERGIRRGSFAEPWKIPRLSAVTVPRKVCCGRGRSRGSSAANKAKGFIAVSRLPASDRPSEPASYFGATSNKRFL